MEWNTGWKNGKLIIWPYVKWIQGGESWRSIQFFLYERGKIRIYAPGTSLVAQWLRICLPMQGSWVRSLVREDPTCHTATKPMRHNYWACALESVSHNYWARLPRAHAPQQEKPPQWEARAPQQRVAPARHNLEKACVQQQRPDAIKNK